MGREDQRCADRVPAPSSAKVMVRKKKRMIRPMFLRNDAILKIRADKSQSVSVSTKSVPSVS